jgi:hypothetical protein
MPADDTKPSRRAPKSGDAPEASANPPPAPGEARPSQQLRAKVAALPAPPEGVSDLFFDEFFKLPVGPKGLEMTERLTSLDGKRVRILGFMVKHPQAIRRSIPQLGAAFETIILRSGNVAGKSAGVPLPRQLSLMAAASSFPFPL